MPTRDLLCWEFVYLVMLHASRELLDASFQLIVNGEMNSKLQADTFLNAGAMAVGLGISLWQVNPEILV